MATPTTQLAQALIAAWNTHDPERLLALFTADLVYEDVPLGVVSHGREEAQRFFREAFAAIPDFHLELAAVVAGEAGGTAEWTMSGTHTGDFPGLPATGKAFAVRGVSVFALAGDKIRHTRDYWDFATMLRQLGLLPAPATA
jgi:steroid delta-isomerase-like uncharacterized protein